MAARLADALRDRALLLVLDNFEHVVEAAPLLAHLLGSCHRLAVLVTSRAPLRVSRRARLPGTAADGCPIPPNRPRALPRPKPSASSSTARQAADPAFALTTENAPAVAAVCQRLAGLPLGRRTGGGAGPGAAARGAAASVDPGVAPLDRRRAGRPGPPADDAGRDRLELRPPAARGAGALPPGLRLRRRLHAGSGRMDRS